MTTYRLGLLKFDGHRATFRSHLPGDDPVHEYVLADLDRDRFNTLGKPGYLDVTITPVALDDPATHPAHHLGGAA